MDENASSVINRAKPWQIALFPFNNTATNVYFALYTFFSYYALMYLTGSASTSLTVSVVSATLVIAVSKFTFVWKNINYQNIKWLKFKQLTLLEKMRLKMVLV